MAYFPLFISMDELPCLVIGAGKVALRKVKTLLDYGARVTVVSPEIHPEIEEMTEIKLIRRRFREEDLAGIRLVFAASSDETCNEEAAELCREKGIMINVADQADRCDFFFPALVRRGDVVTGISTGGKSPAIAGCVRREIENCLPKDLGVFTEKMAELRNEIKKTGNSTEGNADYLSRIEEYFRDRGCVEGETEVSGKQEK